MNKSQKSSTGLTKTIKTFHATLLREKRGLKINRSSKHGPHFVLEYNKTYDNKGPEIV